MEVDLTHWLIYAQAAAHLADTLVPRRTTPWMRTLSGGRATGTVGKHYKRWCGFTGVEIKFRAPTPSPWVND